MVEVKRGLLRVRTQRSEEDVVDQITDYISQCRLKYPGRDEYRGFIIGTGIANPVHLDKKLSGLPEKIAVSVFGSDIPQYIRVCACCCRAIPHHRANCVCEEGDFLASDTHKPVQE